MGFLFKKKNARLNKYSHILAALMVLVHGYEKIEDEHLSTGILFIACGLVFLSVALFHHKLHERIRSVDAIFAFLEGIAAVILAADMWGNKHYLHFAYLFVASIYLVKGIRTFRKSPKPRHAS